MKNEQIKFFDEVIHPKLVEMATNGSLPADMNELSWYYFNAEANAYNNSDEAKRKEAIEKLAFYISEEDVGAALDRLEKVEDGTDSADNHVLMWAPLEDTYTVSELLDMI